MNDDVIINDIKNNNSYDNINLFNTNSFNV